MRLRPVVILLASTAMALGTAGAAPAESTAVANPALTTATFQTYKATAKAITYDTKLVKVGSQVTVIAVPAPTGKTTVSLFVQGLVKNRVYGTHVHQKKCGQLPADAGPHYQNVVDPMQPSVDPKYANPENEIWLDFTTDGKGNAGAASTVNWQFTDRHAASVVIHQEHTHTGGTAGPRLACVNVSF